MKRQVLWAAAALEELDRSIAWIAERNPAAARKVLAEIRKAAEQLGLTATGRRGRVVGTYEKIVAGRPYIVAYALHPEGIVILRVIHAARDWPESAWPGA